MEHQPKNCTVLVNSCDAYADIWDAFFTLLARYWPDRPYPVVLNTESREYAGGPADLSVMHAPDTVKSWTRRLSCVLDQIDSDYILFMLDDFFLTDYVDTARVERCLHWISHDPRIASFTFCYTAVDGLPSPYDGFELRPRRGRYILNATLALWNKSALQRYLQRDETAWQFEVNGTKQSFLSDDDFYIMQDIKPYIFPYNFGKYGLFSGKWLVDTQKLFRENGIAMDFSKRGFFDSVLRSQSESISYMFELDSAVLPYYGLSHDGDPYVPTTEIVTHGAFRQAYAIHGARDIVRWEPSTQWGFCITDFTVTVCYADGAEETVASNAMFGNCLIRKDRLVFNDMSPFLFIITQRDRLLSSISFEGSVQCPADTADLREAAKIKIGLRPRYIDRINDYYTEHLCSKEKTLYIRLRSCVIQQEGRPFGKWTVQYDGKVLHEGAFVQRYEILPSSRRRIRWRAAKYGGFAISGLSFTLQYPDGRSMRVERNCLSGRFITVGDFTVLLNSQSMITILLPAELPSAITITGRMVCPIPREILRKALKLDEKQPELIRNTRSVRLLLSKALGKLRVLLHMKTNSLLAD